MLLLLIQSAFTIFSHEAASNQTNNIDIVIRTSAAAIFGYFLSANFIRHASESHSESHSDSASDSVSDSDSAPDSDSASISDDQGSSSAAPDHSKNVSGNLQTSQDLTAVWASESNPSAPKGNSYNPDTAYRLQVVAASFIGLFCMITLLVYRNILAHSIDAEIPHSILATITQFRDFISGCIGFLIGSPTKPDQKNNQSN